MLFSSISQSLRPRSSSPSQHFFCCWIYRSVSDFLFCATVMPFHVVTGFAGEFVFGSSDLCSCASHTTAQTRPHGPKYSSIFATKCVFLASAKHVHQLYEGFSQNLSQMSAPHTVLLPNLQQLLIITKGSIIIFILVILYPDCVMLIRSFFFSEATQGLVQIPPPPPPPPPQLTFPPCWVLKVVCQN